MKDPRLRCLAISVVVPLAIATACSSSSQPRGENAASAGPAVDAVTPAYEGSHDAAGCGGVVGWARDKNHPAIRLNVDIHDGSNRLGTVPADRMRRDLRDAGLGDGRYGFVYTLPPGVRDGQSHAIRVTVSGTNVDLMNTPKSATCDVNIAVYQGVHDVTNCDTGIVGWVWNMNRPDSMTAVDVYDGETHLITVAADQPREDLRAAGLGTGRYGFVVSIPPALKDGRSHAIRVKVAGTNTDLTGTPQPVGCASGS